MQPFFDSPLVPALVALVPAGVVLWRGRGLRRHLDDPALPERLLAGRQIHGFALGLSITLLVGGWSHTAAWTLPLLFVARLTAAYPARRALYQETWSVGAYLSFFLRLTLAVFAFWILLSAAPALIHAARPHEWAAAALLGVVLVAWNERSVDVFRWILRTRPIEDPELTARFARLIDASGIELPRFEHVAMHGGVFANAVALPSLRRPAVVVSDTLLSRLDGDEVMAIAAHEIAHLEYYRGRRLRQLSLVNCALIAVAALTPLADVLLPSVGSILRYAWPVMVFVALVARAHRRQQQETDADLRAVALTGDPEALVRALTKVHAIARLPRRWDAQFERRATHPSLSRRIKAIHEAGGSRPTTLGDGATFTSADGRASLIFRDEQLQWNEGDVAQHTLRYAHFTELRLDARRSGAARLVAVDGNGRRWEFPLLDADVARAQAALDVVDVRTTAPSAPALSPTVTRWLALLIAMTAMSGHAAVALVALLAALTPERPLTTATAAAALVSAALLLRNNPWGIGEVGAAMSLVIALLGAAMLWLTRLNRADNVSSRSWSLVAALGVCAALAWIALLSTGFNAVRLHQAARAWPAAAILSLALATATAFRRSRAARAGAAAAAFAGLLAIAFGSETFLDRMSDDPFIAPAEPLRVGTMTPRRLGDFPVSFDIDGFRLSPHGESIALFTEREDDGSVCHVGPIGGPYVAFDADDAVFIDDRRALLLAQGPTGVTLKQIEIAATSTVVRQHQLAGIRSGSLSFDERTAAWALTGPDRDNQLVRVAGTAASAAVHERRWTLPGSLGLRSSTIRASDRDALIVETRFDGGVLASSSLRQWAFLFNAGWRSESRLWTV
ncbi:MAG TPA: M48 family metalloprotease, partial [Vicinamibacterales bacterium]|nr:M48 family metalloprotease [Vicinamibacterales bacterium]